MRQISVGNWNTHLCRGHRICLYFVSVLKLNGKPTLKMAEWFGGEIPERRAFEMWHHCFLNTFRQVYSKIREQKVQKSWKDVCFH